MPVNIIGTRTRFLGASGEHPYLLDHDVVIVAVLKGVLIDPDTARVLKTDEEIAAAGGIDPESDRIDVAPMVVDAHAPGGLRPSFATSDAKVADIELFAPTAAVVVEPRVDYAKAEMIRNVTGALARTGRRYQIALDVLDVVSLREMLRLLRDLDQEKDAAVRRARMEPWRG